LIPANSPSAPLPSADNRTTNRNEEQSLISFPAAPNLPPGFDFTDPDIYARRLPVPELAELRRTAPIW